MTIELITLGSRAYTDDAFIEQFENCSYPGGSFHHEDHLRLAWLYLQRYSSRDAENRIAESILRFASNLGAAEKYHHTLTVGWMRLVESARRLTPHVRDFHAFLDAHHWLLKRDALLSFYSREVLISPAAREGWVEPDLSPFALRSPAAWILI